MRKQCKKCEIEKDLSDFYDCKGNRDGKLGSCKQCTKEKVKQYQEQNIEKLQECRKKYYEKKVKENPDYNKENRQKNLEGYRESDRKKYVKQMALDPEKRRNYSKLWARKQKEKDEDFFRKKYARERIRILEYLKTRKVKDAPKLRARNNVNRWLRKGKIIKPIECSECGSKSKLEAHHDDYDKHDMIRWLCIPCHVVADKEKKKRDECKAV